MTDIKITIKNGRYSKDEVAGEFTALGPVKRGTKGWFVAVPGGELGVNGDPMRACRVLLTDAEAAGLKDGPLGRAFLTEDEIYEKAEAEMVHTPESDEQTLGRLREMFDIMNEMGWSMADGDIKGLIVFGPPGVGKSWGLIKAMEEASLAEMSLRHTVYSGFMTPVHLYKSLWENREPGQVAIFDDCDNVLADPDSLNLLKTSLDTTDKRVLSYNAESRLLESEGIDRRFEFNGGIAFITNTDFEHARGKIHDHLQAIISRCHYLDLTIDTKHDKFLWMKEVTLKQNMLQRKGLSLKEAQEIIDFIEENLDEMRELSLRMVLKIADLRKTDTSRYDWRKKARVTCMKRDRHSQLARVFGDERLKSFEDKQKADKRRTSGLA